jgi:hypothetical protein
LPPWELETAPADRLLYYTRIMGIEAEAKQAMDGLGPEEEFFLEG